MTAAHRPVVVGIDESRGAEAALDWAIGEATARHVPLRIVAAYTWKLSGYRAPMYAQAETVQTDREAARADRLVGVAVDRARAGAGDHLSVSGAAVEGDTLDVLLKEASYASLLVVGSRGLGPVKATVLGSLGSAVAARSPIPVVVVRAGGGTATQGAVVVGVDGTVDSSDPIEFAFEFASRHGAPLHAVLCWRPDALATAKWLDVAPPPTPAYELLSEALAGWREKYPDVAVTSEVVRHDPVDGLVTKSKEQRLLVIGSRGRHARVATMLGSVSQGVLHHAACPIAVVPLHAR